MCCYGQRSLSQVRFASRGSEGSGEEKTIDTGKLKQYTRFILYNSEGILRTKSFYDLKQWGGGVGGGGDRERQR